MMLEQAHESTSLNDDWDRAAAPLVDVPPEATLGYVPPRKLYFPRRFLLVLLLSYGGLVDYIIRINTSITIIPMSKKYNWSPRVQGFVLSSFYIGYAPCQIIGGLLANRFGSKWTIAFSMGTAVLLNALIPFASPALPLLIALRICIGVSEAAYFPAATQMLSKWIPSEELAFSVSVAYNGLLIGTVMVFFVSPLIENHISWEASFWIYSIVGVLWFLLWIWQIDEDPSQSLRISDSERNLIMTQRGSGGKASSGKRSIFEVNWKKIFTSKIIYIIFAANFCNSWAFTMMLSWVPTFMHDVYNMSNNVIGFYNAFAYLGQFFAVVIASGLADFMFSKGVALAVVRKWWVWISNFSACVFLALITFSSHPTATQVSWYLTISIVVQGLGGAGTSPAPNDISFQDAAIVQGIGNTAANLPGIVAVYATGELIHTKYSWTAVFLLAQGFFLLGAGIWTYGYDPTRVLD